MKQKHWYLSKMIWINILTVLVGVVGYTAAHDVIQSYPEIVALFIAIQGGVNVVLRFITRKSIG